MMLVLLSGVVTVEFATAYFYEEDMFFCKIKKFQKRKKKINHDKLLAIWEINERGDQPHNFSPTVGIPVSLCEGPRPPVAINGVIMMRPHINSMQYIRILVCLHSLWTWKNRD